MIDFFNIILGVILSLIAIGYGNFLAFIYNRIKAKKMKSLTMKEKLIELLLSAEKVADEEGFFNCHKSRPKAELIADYLIQNGVVILPCKHFVTVEDLK